MCSVGLERPFGSFEQVSEKLDQKNRRRQAEELREREERKRAAQRNSITIGLGVIVVAAVALLIWSQKQSSNAVGASRPVVKPTAVTASLPGVMVTSPPWTANDGASLAPRLKAIGFPKMTAEGNVLHIHQHLDIYVHGGKVTVPQGIGIDAGGAWLTLIHTHDSTGIIHVESPIKRNYTLGQFFSVWGLRFSNRCIGNLCDRGPDQLRVYVNRKRAKDPVGIVLQEHQEITVTYGTRSELPNPIPSSYRFPLGY
jgi:hypothetical protein